MERTNAFVPQNKFEVDSLFLTLYHADIFQQFIAACVGIEVIYEYDDPSREWYSIFYLLVVNIPGITTRMISVSF